MRLERILRLANHYFRVFQALEINNLRTNVSRSATEGLRDFFMYIKETSSRNSVD
jgi:hypothetical protein